MSLVRRLLKLGCIISLVLYLSACGFKLRGYSSDFEHESLPSNSPSVAVFRGEREAAGLGELYGILERQLSRTMTKSSIVEADRIVHVTGEDLQRRSLVLNDAGRALEYQLELTVHAYFIAGEDSQAYLLDTANQALVKKSTVKKNTDKRDLRNAATGSEQSVAMMPQTFTSYREYRYDNRQILAAHQYEQRLLTDMREEIATNILRFASDYTPTQVD